VSCRLEVKDASSNGNGGGQKRDCYCHKHHNASILPQYAISSLVISQ
jgi:hypothetical protein